MKTSQKRQNLCVGRVKTEIRSYEIISVVRRFESNPVRHLGTRTDGGEGNRSQQL